MHLRPRDLYACSFRVESGGCAGRGPIRTVRLPCSAGIMKIDDKAPNPDQPPPEPKMQRPLKPWERARAQQGAASGAASNFTFGTAAGNGHAGASNGQGNGHAAAGPSSPDSPISAPLLLALLLRCTIWRALPACRINARPGQTTLPS